MTIKASITHLLHALMMKCNGWSNSNKWVAHLRASNDNVLAVEHKCRNLLSIKARNNYKRKWTTKPKGTYKYSSKNHSKSISLKTTFSLSNLSIKVFLANTKPVYSISFQNFITNLHWRHDQPQDHPSTETRSSTADFSHHQYLYEIFLPIGCSWVASMLQLSILFPFFNDVILA